MHPYVVAALISQALAKRHRSGLRIAEVISFGPSAKLGMLARRSCLACREEWGMHHRCPALGGRFNCC